MEIHHIPALRNPIMVMAFSGWNDAGEAATGAVEHLLSAWQNDVNKIEADVYNRALGKAAVAAASYSNYQAIVVLDKNAYFQGEKVTGKVVLGKYAIFYYKTPAPAPLQTTFFTGHPKLISTKSG